VGEVSLSTRVKLLRVLREFDGSAASASKVGVRLITATNKDLKRR
jgi:transcriptional regulator with GAF, ATPase, and Fis domain